MSPSARPSRRWTGLLFAIGVAVLLFGAYGPVLTRGPFGINDDYQYLYRTQHGVFDPAHNEIAGMGRPVNAWADQIAYGLCAGKVARLVWLRGFTTAGVGVFAWMLGRLLAGLGYAEGFAATVAALVALTPAAGVYAAYASAVNVSIALCAALGAGSLLVGRPDHWRRDLAAGGLIVLASCTWQAAVPLAMFPVLAAEWRRTDERRELFAGPRAARWWRPWLVGALAVATYGTACVLAARLGAVSAGGSSRLAVATDVAAKGRFFLSLLRNGVTSWARLQLGPWEWAVGIVTTIACFAALPAGRGSLTACRLALAAFMVLISVAPLLAAREDNGAFRALICLYVTVAFLGVAGARRLLARAPGPTRAIVAGLAVVASVGAARYHVWHGLVEPNLREYVGVRDEMRRQFPDAVPAHVVYLVPPYTPLIAGRFTASWEYGLTSSNFWWVTRPFLLVAFADALPDKPVPPDLRVSYREAGNPGVPVLQTLPVLLREDGGWRDDPRWGRVCAYRGGWLYSPWFGYFNDRWFPYVEHHLLGGLLFSSQEKDGKDLWFYHAGLGHFYTSPGQYPHLLLGGKDRWVTVSDDMPSQVVLSDDVTGERLPYPR